MHQELLFEDLAPAFNLIRLGSVLRALRKRQSWTLEMLRDKTDISLGYISQIERGRASPSLDKLKRITSALGQSMWIVVKWAEEEKT